MARGYLGFTENPGYITRMFQFAASQSDWGLENAEAIEMQQLLKA